MYVKIVDALYFTYFFSFLNAVLKTKLPLPVMLWIHHKRPKEQTNLLLLIQFFIFRYLLYTFWCYFQRKSPVMDYIKIVDPKQMYGNSYFISVFSLLLLLELLFLCISC